MKFRVPSAIRPVRERVLLDERQAGFRRGERALTVDRQCEELIKDFEQVTYKDEQPGD